MRKLILAILSLSATTAFAADIPMSEVAKHKTASDCWMAINGKVYDATKCYKEPKAGKTHSNSADKMMKYFFKGNLAK